MYCSSVHFLFFSYDFLGCCFCCGRLNLAVVAVALLLCCCCGCAAAASAIVVVVVIIVVAVFSLAVIAVI